LHFVPFSTARAVKAAISPWLGGVMLAPPTLPQAPTRLEPLLCVKSEKRKLRGEALLAVEDAKEQLALLRVKAASWARLFENVHYLLVRMNRDSSVMQDAAVRTRRDVEARLSETVEAMDLQAVLGS